MPARCPHTDTFQVGPRLYTAQEILDGLDEYVTEERRARMEAVVAGRTYSVVPVLEGLYDYGNISAVMRTAEALGCQALHIIDLQERYKLANRVTQGADKWLDICHWCNTRACVTWLRAHGYQIAAMCMEGARPIAECPFDAPTALVFGSEHSGVTRELMELADTRVVIPMPGFTRSFNISVAAALALYHARNERLRASGRHGDLSEAERRALTAAWYLRSVPHAAKLLAVKSR